MKTIIGINVGVFLFAALATYLSGDLMACLVALSAAGVFANLYFDAKEDTE